jgi:osmotically-inducible protein OsmY
MQLEMPSLERIPRPWAGQEREGADTRRDALKRKAEGMRSKAVSGRSQTETAAENMRDKLEARARKIQSRVREARKPAKPDRRSQIAVGAAGVAAGVVAAFFLDPQAGKRRRAIVRDKAVSFARGAGRRARRMASYRAKQAKGVAHEAAPDRDREGRAIDDNTLADKVRSEVLRKPDLPSGAVNVNVEHGVVYLRGELPDSEKIERLVKHAAEVEGVGGVESLLHVPGEPVPNR